MEADTAEICCSFVGVTLGGILLLLCALLIIHWLQPKFKVLITLCESKHQTWKNCGVISKVFILSDAVTNSVLFPVTLCVWVIVLISQLIFYCIWIYLEKQRIWWTKVSVSCCKNWIIIYFGETVVQTGSRKRCCQFVRKRGKECECLHIREGK